MKNRKIKVLIVDDSSVVRQTMTNILDSDPDIEIMAVASDPYVAAQKIKKEIPDVITLDIEMPRMDGITFLQKVMSQHPIPIVICSSMAGNGSENALRAMEYGAIDIIEKPKMGTKSFLEESKIQVCDTVKAAAKVKVKPVRKTHVIEKKLTADAVIEKAPKSRVIQTTEKIVVVGASTGGTEALRIFLESLPQDSPGIVIVQHMPENFTRAFSERLNGTLPGGSKRSDRRGQCAMRPGSNSSWKPPSFTQTQRGAILYGDQGRASCQPSSSICGCAFSLCGPVCRS